MSDALALTFGSDLSGNSNIATISIASHTCNGDGITAESILRSGYSSVYRVAWPTGATDVLVRPTFYPGRYIIVSGVCIIDNTMSTSHIATFATNYINISSSPTANTVTAYAYSNNQYSTCLSTSSYTSSGFVFSTVYIFF